MAVNETWTGSNGAAWNGTTWPTTTGSPTIQSNRGRLTTGTALFGENSSASLADIVPADGQGTLDILVGEATVSHELRWRYRGNFAAGDYYSLGIDPAGDYWFLFRYDNFSLTVVDDGNFGFSLSVGDVLHVRLYLSGSAHKLRFWRNSDPEPSTWDMEATQSNHATNDRVEFGAVNNAGSTSFNIDLDNFVFGPFSAPDAPAAPSVAAGHGNVQATVVPPADGGSAITDYVWQSAPGPGYSSWSTFSDGTSTNTAVAITGLTNGTSYKVRVAAVNANGQSAYSAESSAVTPVDLIALLALEDGSSLLVTEAGNPLVTEP